MGKKSAIVMASLLFGFLVLSVLIGYLVPIFMHDKAMKDKGKSVVNPVERKMKVHSEELLMDECSHLAIAMALDDVDDIVKSRNHRSTMTDSKGGIVYYWISLESSEHLPVGNICRVTFNDSGVVYGIEKISTLEANKKPIRS